MESATDVKLMEVFFNSGEVPENLASASNAMMYGDHYSPIKAIGEILWRIVPHGAIESV